MAREAARLIEVVVFSAKPKAVRGDLPVRGLPMRRRDEQWLVAGFDFSVLRPGWPPPADILEVDGYNFDFNV